MKSYLTIKKEITSSMVDSTHKLRFDAILNTFQDLATAHATQMGMGFIDLKNSSNAFWVLSKIRFNLDGSIYQNQTIKATTWPLAPSTFRFVRDFVISSESGKVLGSSEWCLLDFDTIGLRKLSSVNYPSQLKHLKKRSNAGDFNRIKIELTNEDYLYDYTATFCDIDCNNHVNNVSYAKMALNCFTPNEFNDFNFKGFEIQFITQTYYGDKISIYKKTIENGVYVEGVCKDKTIFKSIFEY